MIAIPIKIVDSAIAKYKPKIDVFVKEAKTKVVALEKRERKNLNAAESDYLRKLITDFEAIVIAPPSGLLTFQNDLGLLPKRIAKKGKKGKKQKSLKDKIIDAMGYATHRGNFYPKYFQSIGIKACVYCNAQLAVVVDSIDSKKNKTVKAKFQVDHYIAKSDYPCLSISLFNLYPVCASCNNSKSDKKIAFKLYENPIGAIKSEFEFILDKASQAKFILSRNVDDIKIDFRPPPTPAGYDDYSETFDIQGIYDTQKDLAEELILKAEAYTPKYKASLIEAFDTIFTPSSLSNRIIIGNYVEKHEIHKRPMAKFTQDIAEQVGLV